MSLDICSDFGYINASYGRIYVDDVQTNIWYLIIRS